MPLKELINYLKERKYVFNVEIDKKDTFIRIMNVTILLNEIYKIVEFFPKMSKQGILIHFDKGFIIISILTSILFEE